MPFFPALHRGVVHLSRPRRQLFAQIALLHLARRLPDVLFLQLLRLTRPRSASYPVLLDGGDLARARVVVQHDEAHLARRLAHDAPVPTSVWARIDEGRYCARQTASRVELPRGTRDPLALPRHRLTGPVASTALFAVQPNAIDQH